MTTTMSRVNSLVNRHFMVIDDEETLKKLPEFSIILCEVEEYTGSRLLIREGKEWLEASIFDDGCIEGCDDYTPELPALLIMAPYVGDDDF